MIAYIIHDTNIITIKTAKKYTTGSYGFSQVMSLVAGSSDYKYFNKKQIFLVDFKNFSLIFIH